MGKNAGIFIVISLLFLVGIVGAVGIPDTVTITTDNPWIIANNVDQSTITVTVLNTTISNNGPVSGAPVILTINDPVYGTLSATTVTTDASGKASSTFNVKTKSGAVQIAAFIASPAISGSTIQYIDHDSPYNVIFEHPNEGEVANEVPFKMSVIDRWGNRIDNLNPSEIHTVKLSVHGPNPDDCYFVGYGHDISPALDSNGNLAVNIKLTSIIGNNYIFVDSFGGISEKVEWIVVEATSEPYHMTGTISDGGILPVGTQPFVIDYFLYDVYGNPLRNQSISVNTTSLNEQKIYTSNSLGQIRLYYGPAITASDITITASSLSNSSVMIILVAHFVNSDPTNMVLAVTPQTLESREIPTSQPAFVVGKVTDARGNPITGQAVTFTISNIVTATYHKTSDPSFESGFISLTKTETTDSNGNAIVTIYPGSFVTEGQAGYRAGATGA